MDGFDEIISVFQCLVSVQSISISHFYAELTGFFSLLLKKLDSHTETSLQQI